LKKKTSAPCMVGLPTGSPGGSPFFWGLCLGGRCLALMMNLPNTIILTVA
jgi:hypothetical protein